MAVAVAWAASASASGYHFGVQSVSAQGTANANGAEVADASALFFNPAASAYLPGRNLSLAVVAVKPDMKIESASATTAQGLPVTSGGDAQKPTQTVFVPQSFMSWQINETLSAGLGVFVPFGDKLNYDKYWAGRYNADELKMMTLALNPSLALRVNDQLSVGMGLTAQYMNAAYQKQVDFGTLLSEAGVPAKPGDPRFDGILRYKGKDWGYGYNLGVYWQPDATTRVGAAYRSSISQRLSGTAQWRLPTLPSSITGALEKQGFRTGSGDVHLRTPDSFTLNGYRQIDDRFSVVADWTYTWHSRFDELRLKFNSALPDAVIRQNWKNSQRFSLGGSYRYSDRLTLRAGAAYDQSPVPSSADRIAGLPDGNRTWYSLGSRVMFGKDASLDLAYSYVKVGQVEIHNTECEYPACTGSGTTTHARLKAHAHILGMQFNQRF
ncbi:putative outer membrane protein [Paludibacterium paludis]|uniref:Outer membrane protein n=1 Tax=Paludibacterium paludis TaxID=1225769 RepID=A0A918P1X0_9NEIS|nr:putative outer membrane protein [Paludibacterium paludis]